MQKRKAVCPRAHSEWEVNLELRVPCSYILHFTKWTAFYFIAYLIFQYSGHLIQTVDSLEKSLMLENIEGRRRRGCQRMRWLDGISDAMDMNLGKFWELVRDRKAWSVAVHRLAKSQTPRATEKQGSTLPLCTSTVLIKVSHRNQVPWLRPFTMRHGLPWWLSGQKISAMHEMQEMSVQSLDREDSLEEGMATHSCIPA